MTHLDVPVVTARLRVPSGWIDVNGHMNALYYAQAMYGGHVALTQLIGLGDAYVAASGCSKAVLESHIVYEREALRGDELEVRSWLFAVDTKRLHFFHELYNLTRGWRAATGEQVDIHIDLTQRRSVPFPPALYRALQLRVRANLAVSPPPGIGSRIRPPTNPWRDTPVSP
ncbi:MAG TPA: thioesterase family protein [Nevskiaceae bacterium]|nr:thioesterase family protein [Nevskiaceae bacterium]